MNKFAIALVSLVVSLLISAMAPALVFAQGDAAAGKAKSALCGSCHGVDGNSALAMNPKLAGQGAGYLYKQLVEFKSGARQNATMAAMVMSLSDQDMLDLSAYYASQQVTIGGAAYRTWRVDLPRWQQRARCCRLYLMPLNRWHR